MKEKLDKRQLLALLDKIMHPTVDGTEDEDVHALNEFCAGCPDPVGARWLLVECIEPMTDEEVVARALAMPFRCMADISFSELPKGHALREMAL
jgi:hypothetical protein